MDVTRLAHHAAGAQDCAAILEYAPAAARDAAAATAHREAAALYGWRWAAPTSSPPRARCPARGLLLGVQRHRPAPGGDRGAADGRGLWRDAGDPLKQAENLARQVPMLIGVGSNDDGRRCSDEAVSAARAAAAWSGVRPRCRMEALVALARRDPTASIRWGERAIELARAVRRRGRAGMTESAVGSAWMILDYERGRDYLEQRLRRALDEGRATHAANAFAHLGRSSVELYEFDCAERYLTEGSGVRRRTRP